MKVNLLTVKTLHTSKDTTNLKPFQTRTIDQIENGVFLSSQIQSVSNWMLKKSLRVPYF